MAAIAHARSAAESLRVERTTRLPQLPALTGLRFFAAILVVCLHYTSTFWATHSAVLYRIVSSGQVGVSVFFVLSGFILAYTYPVQRGIIRGGTWRFWQNRFARVYPAYLVAALLALPLVPWDLAPRFGVGAGFATLSLLQAWVPSIATVWNGPGWSLSAEAIFYLCFPFLAPAIFRLSARRLVQLLAALWLLLLMVPVSYQILRPDGPAPTWNATWMAVISFNPLSRLPEFIAGMVLGRLFVLQRQEKLQPPHWVSATIVPLGVASSIGCLALGPSIPYAYTVHGVFDPAFAALIYGLALQKRSGVTWLLSSAPMVALGEASYSVYLLQAPTYGWVCHLLGLTNAQGVAVPAVVAGDLVLLTVLALAFHRLVEVPLRGWIRRWRLHGVP